MDTRDVEALAQSVVERWGWRWRRRYGAPRGVVLEHARRGIEAGLATYDGQKGPLEAWLRANAKWAVWKGLSWRRNAVRRLPRHDHAPRSVRTEPLEARVAARAAEVRSSELADEVAWAEAREHYLGGLSARQAWLVAERLAGRTVAEIAASDGKAVATVERDLGEIRGLLSRALASGSTAPWVLTFPTRPRIVATRRR